MSGKFMLLCGCGWKMVSDLSETGLYEVRNDAMGPRKFRCPVCGFAVTPRPTKDPQSEADRKAAEIKVAEEDRRWLEESARERAEFMEKITNEQEDNAE